MGAAVSVEAARYQRSNGVGKNWTKEELERREEEAAKLNSKNKKMTMPGWLKGEHKERARVVWSQTLNSVQDIELFSACDSEMLATYCDICVQYEEATSRSMPYAKDIDRLGKLKMTYAEKLGLTPVSRARLVVARAKKEDKKEELFD